VSKYSYKKKQRRLRSKKKKIGKNLSPRNRKARCNLAEKKELEPPTE
jgi:hypothetical protein